MPENSRTRSISPRAASIIARWPAADGGRPLGPDASLRQAGEDLVADVVGRLPVDGALARLGRQAGQEGWPLPDVADWVAQLAEAAGADGRALTGFASGMVLATAWADGFLYGAEHQGCVDPFTGLATLGVLRLRLAQVRDQCRALQLDPSMVYALVVVDADLRSIPPLRRHAVRMEVAEEVWRIFSEGQTAAGAGDRVLVLASRTPDLEDRLAVLSIGLHQHAELREVGVLVWVETLPTDGGQLDRLLDELSA